MRGEGCWVVVLEFRAQNALNGTRKGVREVMGGGWWVSEVFLDVEGRASLIGELVVTVDGGGGVHATEGVNEGAEGFALLRGAGVLG